MIPWEKTKIASFTSSRIKTIVAPLKLICYNVLDQHQVLVVYLNLLLSSYNDCWNKNNLANNQIYNNFHDNL